MHPQVSGVSKNTENRTEAHSGELERKKIQPKLKKLWKNIKIEQKL